eukprot:m.351823 g.351823  ORF g.351823 m.351823 type:complete len:661 (-) comp19898_c10_seq1:91-2073(-)
MWVTTATATTTRGQTAVQELPLAKARMGKKFRFVVTVLDARGLSVQFTDVFCQFRFETKSSSAFTTESLQNQGDVLSFYHAQQVCVDVSPHTLRVLHDSSLVFEMFGHYESHPLHAMAAASSMDNLLGSPQTPLRDQLTAIASTSEQLLSPGRPRGQGLAATTAAAAASSSNALQQQPQHPSHDLLGWFEVCELAPDGSYLPVLVDHSDEERSGTANGTFLLTQGMQRRVVLVVSHEQRAKFSWDKVLDMTIGNIRTVAETDATVTASPALSLTILPGLIKHTVADDRSFLRLEAAWDSSRHDSLFLNRVTPMDQRVFVTLSAVIEVAGCARPASIRKTLCLRLCGRDSKPTFAKSSGLSRLFGPKPPPDSNKSSAVYQLVLTPQKSSQLNLASSTAAAASVYVRGEENLKGWRPRGSSLIAEHFAEIERQHNLAEVERSRQLLALSQELTANTEQANTASPAGGTEQQQDASSESETDPPEILRRAVALLQQRDLLTRARHGDGGGGADDGGEADGGSGQADADGDKGKPDAEPVLMYPTITEQPLADTVQLQGALNFLDNRDSGWKRRWVVIRRPYVLVYDNERDSVVRQVVNLGTAKVQYSEDQGVMMGIPNVFTLCTQHRGFLLQAAKATLLHQWLYALDPLLAGSIISREGLKKR